MSPETTDLGDYHDNRKVEAHLRPVLKRLQEQGHLLPDEDDGDWQFDRVHNLATRAFYARTEDGDYGDALRGNDRIAALRDQLARDLAAPSPSHVRPTFDPSMIPDLPAAKAAPETPDQRDAKPHQWPSETERVMTGILDRMSRVGYLRFGARAEIEKALAADPEARHPEGAVAVLFRSLANPATARRWLEDEKAPDGVMTFKAMLRCFPLEAASFDKLAREWAMGASSYHPDSYREHEVEGRRVSEEAARELAVENMARWLHRTLESRENWGHVRPRYRPPVPAHEARVKAVLDGFAPELSPSVARDTLATKWAVELPPHAPRHEIARTVAERIKLWPDLRRDPETVPTFRHDDPRFAEEAPDPKAREELLASGGYGGL